MTSPWQGFPRGGNKVRLERERQAKFDGLARRNFGDGYDPSNPQHRAAARTAQDQQARERNLQHNMTGQHPAAVQVYTGTPQTTTIKDMIAVLAAEKRLPPPRRNSRAVKHAGDSNQRAETNTPPKPAMDYHQQDVFVNGPTSSSVTSYGDDEEQATSLPVVRFPQTLATMAGARTSPNSLASRRSDEDYYNTYWNDITPATSDHKEFVSLPARSSELVISNDADFEPSLVMSSVKKLTGEVIGATSEMYPLSLPSSAPLVTHGDDMVKVNLDELKNVTSFLQVKLDGQDDYMESLLIGINLLFDHYEPQVMGVAQIKEQWISKFKEELETLFAINQNFQAQAEELGESLTRKCDELRKKKEKYEKPNDEMGHLREDCETSQAVKDESDNYIKIAESTIEEESFQKTAIIDRYEDKMVEQAHLVDDLATACDSLSGEVSVLHVEGDIVQEKLRDFRGEVGYLKSSNQQVDSLKRQVHDLRNEKVEVVRDHGDQVSRKYTEFDKQLGRAQNIKEQLVTHNDYSKLSSAESQHFRARA